LQLQREHACAEQVDAGAPIHGPFQHFQPVDLAFSLTTAPRLADSVLNGIDIVLQDANETLQGVDARTVCFLRSLLQLSGVVTAENASKAHREPTHNREVCRHRLESVHHGGLVFR
jgi:hypothetical protein